MRVGFGYDSHVFSEDPGRRLVLGGVVLAGERGLQAHSDGDVLVHALIDALLGAAALGDIGGFFPDTDPRWAGADSLSMLAAALSAVRTAGFAPVNADLTVVCERPKIRPHADAIRERLAAALGIDRAAVSVKGKTNERMDDVGAGKGIVAYAAVLLDG